MKTSLMARLLVVVFFAFGLLANASHAQSTNAAVGGQITDEQGRVVPGVTVVLTNLNTGVPYEAKTNGDGFYNAPNLPPGVYRANVTKDGFKNIVKGDIELHVQDVASINFQLQIGSVSETVTVEAGAHVINTTDATVGTVIDRNFAENLPLNGRSFQTLILLAPGTVLVPTTDGSSNNGGQFSVNGQRTNANSFSVDGVSANLGGRLYQSNPGQSNGANPSLTLAGTTQGMVAVDALQEFKIQTSTYAPEFGRQPGGQISLLTRSGTNLFHGTAFDYLRNDVFDANNWFNDAQGLPKGKERQNDFGSTFGGPIFKDKTFFFFSYEGLRLLQPLTRVQKVPSLRLRQEATPANQAILNSWPIPDGPEFMSNGQPTGGAPYTQSESFPSSLDSYGIKVDHSIGKRLHLFGRYSDTNSTAGTIAFPDIVNTALRSRALTLGTDLIVRPNLQNELRLNYSVNASQFLYNQDIIGGAKAFDASVLFPAPLDASIDVATWRLIKPGLVLITTQGPSGKFSQRQINVVDNFSYSVGSHQLKWGIDYRRLFPIYARAPLEPVYTLRSENDIKNGNVSIASVNAFLSAHPIYTNLSIFMQDSWKISNRLALTYGVRWEFDPSPGERDGRQPLNVVGLNDPATATLAPLNSSMYKTTYDNFAPRIGLAYQIRQVPGHETVVRAGFGLFYDLDSETSGLGFAGGAPFENDSPPLTNISFPVASNVLPAPPVPAPLTPPYFVNAIDPNLKLPYTLQWNVSVEQALGQNQSASVSYVASSGDRLLRLDTLFGFNPNFTNVYVVRNASSSTYQSLQLQFNRRFSRGLQALVSYTYSHSIDNASDARAFLSGAASGAAFLNPNIDRGNSSFDLRHSFRAAFTYAIPSWRTNFFSRAIFGGWSTDAIAIAQTGIPVDLVGGNYFLPNGNFLQLRPNVVGGIPLYLFGAQCTAANGGVPCPGGRAINFTPGAVVGGCSGGFASVGPFCPVPTDANGNPTQVQGTLGRNALRGFGAWQIDFALHRQFNLTERFNLQFRSEFFNILNHPNFGGIDNFLGSGTFGQPTQSLNSNFGGLNSLYQIGGPRSIQLALKLVF